MEEYFKKAIPKIEKEVKNFFLESVNDRWIKENIGDFNYKFNLGAWKKAFYEPFYNLFARGGKRIRPVLCCLIHNALDGDNNDIYKFSIISEIIHSGTLIIDDIEDKSKFRRGGRSIHKIFGQEIALNCGNFLYFFPQLIIKNSRLSMTQKAELYNVIASEMTKVHLGQGMDILWSKKESDGILMSEYLQMCAYKTGALLSIAIKTGAILVETDDKVLDKLGKLAEKIGIAFQIQDDILNLKPSRGWGKEEGEDIIEGKITYLVVDTFLQSQKKDKERLKKILFSKIKGEKEINEAIEIMEKYKAFDRALKFIQKLFLSAQNDIDEIFQDSDYKRIFLEILDYMGNRKK